MDFDPREKPRRYLPTIGLWLLAGALMMLWAAVNHFTPMD